MVGEGSREVVGGGSREVVGGGCTPLYTVRVPMRSASLCRGGTVCTPRVHQPDQQHDVHGDIMPGSVSAAM